MSFYVTLQSNFQHVMVYENPELQQKARSHIPLQQLTTAAQHKLKEAKKADPGDVPSLLHFNHIYGISALFCFCKVFNVPLCLLSCL